MDSKSGSTNKDTPMKKIVSKGFPVLTAVMLLIGMAVAFTGCIDDEDGYSLKIDIEGEGEVEVEPDKDEYENGTEVDLNATPDPGYEFGEWTGNTTTIENISSRDTTMTIEDDYNITANFYKFEIEDWHDLHAVRDYLNGDYVLINDLDDDTDYYDEYASEEANDGKGWEPIGDLDTKFAGSFDGQGHEIRDLYIYRPEEDDVALFGATHQRAEVNNVGVIDGDIRGDTRVALLIGNNEGDVDRSYTSGYLTGDNGAGGLIGRNRGKVSNTYSAGDVDASSLYSGWFGGLVGYNYGIIKDSYATGSVSGYFGGGGLVGLGDVSGDVSNSFGDINSTGQDMGMGGTGKTTAEMKDVATFTDLSTEGLDETWDFVGDPYDDEGEEDVWDIDRTGEINDGYPSLSWQVTEEFNLTVNIEGEGVVELDPNQDEYEEGTKVTLTATAEEDWYFVEWSGDKEGTNEELTVTMDEDKTITALFEEDEDTTDTWLIAMLILSVIALIVMLWIGILRGEKRSDEPSDEESVEEEEAEAGYEEDSQEFDDLGE